VNQLPPPNSNQSGFGQYAPPAAPQQFAQPVPWAVSGPGGGPPQTRSGFQWQAYVRIRLFDGWPVERVLAELAAAGVDMHAARNCVAEARRIMIRRLVSYFVWGPIMILIGVLAVVGATANTQQTGRENYLIMMGVLVPFGGLYIYQGLLILSRVPRLPKL
jgi:hypothetical protein